MGAQLILGAQQILMVLGAQGAQGAQTMNCTIAAFPIPQGKRNIWMVCNPNVKKNAIAHWKSNWPMIKELPKGIWGLRSPRLLSVNSIEGVGEEEQDGNAKLGTMNWGRVWHENMMKDNVMIIKHVSMRLRECETTNPNHSRYRNPGWSWCPAHFGRSRPGSWESVMRLKNK